ncbi:MAG: GSCFA domain-containing protein [Leadbetterella sp.]|nr:GSCFA domain-containing protein [Leadbetterella sp.]
MSEFRTVIEKINPEFQISLKSKILTLGSCFSDVLGNYLVENKIECLANPFGNVFNLSSISNLLDELLEPSENNEDTIVENDGVFFHYNYHSEIRDFTKVGLVEKIKTLNNSIGSFLKSANFLIITLGTSWVYEQKQTQKIVSNCHKQKAALFNKKLIGEKEQLDIFENIYSKLKTFNPNLKIILTVSPVRHIKDTIQLNSVSKSILRTLCYAITSRYYDTYYFPSYEIVIDDLRDYRFYKSDLIHPNEQAEKYILNIFSETYFDNTLKIFINDWIKIKTGIDHRPFNPKSKNHKKFLQNLLIKIQTFENQIDISKEEAAIKNQIS